MSLSDDAKNRFDRQRPQTPTSLEQKNRFDRGEDKRNAERADTTAYDNRVKRNAEDNMRWVSKNLQPVSAGGIRLTPNLAKDKAASDASRAELKRTPVTRVSVESVVETVAAIVRDWKASTESGRNYAALFEQNDWTREQMNNITQSLLQQGHPVNAALPEKAFQIAYAGNHLDPRRRTDRAGNTIRLRGEARRPAPVPFPRVIWPDEAAAIQEEQAQQALATAAAETSRAKKLPFDQLKREATKDRKSEPALMGPVW
jgi:hypothetical protein